MQSLPPTVIPTPHPFADLDRLGDEIAELSAHLDAATARLLDLIREFDARDGWNGGFRSCAAWLSWRVGLDLGAAREKVRVARALGTLPLLAEALRPGELSYAKVRALTLVATPETEARLLGVGRAGAAAHVERIVRGWRSVDRRAEARESAPRHRNRALHVYQDEDGTVVLRGRLEPEVGALLTQALAAAREVLSQGASVHKGDVGRGNVSAETSWRLACDASRVVMRHDEEGRVLEIGVRTRTIPPALRRALLHRDRGCRVRFGRGHHLHHRAVHVEGFHVARGPDGALRFKRPDGRPLLEVPVPVAVPGDAVGALRARHGADGLRLTARTACPSWLGERLNVGWAIDVLHPLAQKRPSLGDLGSGRQDQSVDPRDR